MTKTGDYLKWLAEQCKSWGVDIKTDSVYLNKKLSKKYVDITYRNKGKLKKVRTRFVIGADGALSRVAKTFNLSENKELIFGVEHIYKGVKGVNKNSFYLFPDYNLAPGYLCWVAPNEEKTHVGLIGYQKKVNLNQSIVDFEKKIKNIFDFSNSKLIDKKKGFIPIGNLLKKTFNNRCMLLGDSAGMVTSLSCGGIFPSLFYSIKAGECVSDYLLNNNKKAFEVYSDYKGEIKNHLNLSYKLRKIYDSLNNNQLLEDAFDLLNTKQGKKLFKKLYLPGEISKGHSWKTIFESFEEYLMDPKVYPLFGKLILDEIKK